MGQARDIDWSPYVDKSRSYHGGTLEYRYRYLVIWSNGKCAVLIMSAHANIQSQPISLIYGGDFNLFRPKKVPYGHEEYGQEALKRQFQYFGPFPGKYEQISSSETGSNLVPDAGDPSIRNNTFPKNS
jgi:hypothetical protein